MASQLAQAAKFGAQLHVASGVTRLVCDDGALVVQLGTGACVPARAVIVATGAAYRRLPLRAVTRFEGAGVYYAATFTEARLCGGEEVAVVGGGNAAGQAALFLADHTRHVHLVVRAAGLDESMSRYLVQRIEDHPQITLRTRTEITALDGAGHLARVCWVDRRTGAADTRDLRHLFTMTGADPCTAWLHGCVALDEKGFVKTAPDLTPGELADAHWPRARPPYLLETSRPGVFAVGDVRAGSVKRVASAVGEGAIAVSFVHRALRESP